MGVKSRVTWCDVILFTKVLTELDGWEIHNSFLEGCFIVIDEMELVICIKIILNFMIE